VLHDGDRASTPFPWALVGADQVERHAAQAGLRVRESWSEDGRWFAALAR
jgi:hypothetical protein